MTRSEPPLVLVHGFAQTPASWGEVIELLGADASLVAVELPGHGATGLSRGEPTPELTNSLILEACATFDQKPVVWGYSMGGRATFDFLINHPGIVRAAVVESATPGIADPLARAERRSRDFAMSKRLEAGTIEEFVGGWEQLPAIGEQSPEVIAKQRPIRLAQDPVALAAAVRGIGQASFEPRWSRLGELELPVLLLTGANDAAYEAHSEHMAELLPDARHISVAGAAHAVHISHPREAVAAVRSFNSTL